ncbi:MAG: hypothetical protein U9Q81_25700 [Pseudomonadota bacterium]|nr:hypothetical protein [Pseudomonadota bacterium]
MQDDARNRRIVGDEGHMPLENLLQSLQRTVVLRRLVLQQGLIKR